MCLGCLVASMGLSYDSEEAQEFIQQAIGSDDCGCPEVYGVVHSHSYSQPVANYNEVVSDYGG